MTSDAAQRTTYQFGNVTIDRDCFRVFKGKQIRPLTPRAFDVLVYLVEQNGRVVGRDELFEQLWKGAFVTDNALTRVIKEIRRAIGDDAGTPRYLETIPKRGYRFIGEAVAGASRKPSQRLRKSLAVLPFTNTSTNVEAEYLSDGIASSIISNLSQLSAIRVLARSTVFSYKHRDVKPQQIGRELNANAVLTGELRQVGDRLVVNAELADATDGTQLWGQQYTRRLADIFDIQEEIAREISEKLRLKLSSQERKQLAKRHTEDAEAYQLYLKGYYWLYKFTPEGLNRSFEYFNSAIERDAEYALAYAGLVEAYFNLSFFSSPVEVWAKAKEAALQALKLDSKLAQAHYSMALVSICYDRDWDRAEREFQRAIELEPNFPLAHEWYGWSVLAQSGRFAEALAETRKAVDLDPLSLPANTDYGSCLYWAGQYESAIEQLEKTLEMEPQFFIARTYLGMIYLKLGDLSAAVCELERAAESQFPLTFGFLGCAYGRAGKKGKARSILKKLTAQASNNYVPADAFGLVHMGLGEKDLAFEYLRKACDERTAVSLSLLVDPVFDSLRSSAQFKSLLKRIRVKRLAART